MQGFNKYYPSDYDPSQGSLNKLNGKHALGDRARKLDQGILIVRFELPYNIWCSSCNNHIGQGVRYNAEKSKVGNYYTTPIWNFRCKCHLCSSWFEIRTDPQNTRYVVHSGAKQQNQEWDPAENGGYVLDEKKPDGTPVDAFESLEKTQTQKKKALTAATQLNALEIDRDQHWSDPYLLSSRLRSTFRKEKKIRLESEAKALSVADRYGLDKDRLEAKNYLRTPVNKEERASEDKEWNLVKLARSRRQIAPQRKTPQDDLKARLLKGSNSSAFGSFDRASSTSSLPRKATSSLDDKVKIKKRKPMN